MFELALTLFSIFQKQKKTKTKTKTKNIIEIAKELRFYKVWYVIIKKKKPSKYKLK